MAVENLCSGSILQNVSFELRTGEVLGVTGLAGSGLRELSKGSVRGVGFAGLRPDPHPRNSGPRERSGGFA